MAGDPDLEFVTLGHVRVDEDLPPNPLDALGALEMKWKTLTLLLLDAGERRHPGIRDAMEKVAKMMDELQVRVGAA